MSRRPRSEKGSKADPAGSSAPARANLLQRKCACGASAGVSGECEACSKKQLSTQEGHSVQTEDLHRPSTVSDVLNSPCQPLDPATRAQVESRFGHDFSKVRVHADDLAAASAQEMNASAYTIGQDIVFGQGKYDPQSEDGKQRLAHELTHVVQQRLQSASGPASSDAAESEARLVGKVVSAGQAARVITPAAAGHVQRDEGKNVVDAKAKAIIALAKDDKTKAEDRAVAIVKQIIKEYYSKDEALVHSVAYDDAKAGSGAHAQEKFAKSSKNEESTGIIYVGDTFLKGVDEIHFARRVLQVGHEIEHIHQWREGMAGGQRSNEREFLAFYHEALLPEKPGTGRMQHSTRLRLIDAALGNYYCLASDKQTDQAAKKKELLDRRATEITAGGKPDKADPPTECKKSS